jgi:LytS/YehU family sensor histidine kinase
MIIYKENANAQKYLSIFADILRSRLENSKVSFISLYSELEIINQYIEIEKLRIKNLSIKHEIDHSINTSQLKIPPYILQPLIEEHLWSAIAQKSENKEILIKLFSKYSSIYFEVIGKNLSEGMNEEDEEKYLHNIQVIINRVNLFNKKHKTNYKLELLEDSKDKHTTETVLRFTI